MITERELADIVQKRPGVYFFSRKYGNSFEPFYIGETKSILGRLKLHLKSRGIAYALETDPKKYLDIAQRYLIRQEISEKCNVLNKNLTRKKLHFIEFSGDPKGRAIFPTSANIETN